MLSWQSLLQEWGLLWLRGHHQSGPALLSCPDLVFVLFMAHPTSLWRSWGAVGTQFLLY